LLARLNIDHFLLDLETPVDSAPVIEGVQIERVADKILNVGVPKAFGLNRLFSELTARGVKVISLKNKSNRLEQLFLDLIDAKSQGARGL
jgi:ABC-2 type transport system ATP-binding protein